MTNDVILIKLYKNGYQWCALIGEDLQSGTCGFGDTKSDALHALITAIEHQDEASEEL